MHDLITGYREAKLRMNILYLVPLPLGDPDDITMRALRILGEVRAIAADDTTTARALLDGYGIATPLIGYGDVFDALARGDVALISTRGTPGIGTGQEIVQAAIAQGIQVVPLPGADATITALVLSGLPTDAFVYAGALPDDVSRYANERATLIFVTDDVTDAIRQIMAAFGERRVSIFKLKQPNEAAYRGTLKNIPSPPTPLPRDRGEGRKNDGVLINRFVENRETRTFGDAANDEINQPDEGSEWVVVVEGAAEQAPEVWDESRVRAELRRRLAAGEPLKLAAKAIANAAGWDRRTVYALGVEEKGNTP